MAASPNHSSKRSPSKSKLKQKSSVWETKRKLVMQRLEGLEKLCNNDDSVDTKMPVVCYSPKASPRNDAQNRLTSDTGVSTSAIEQADEIRANLPPQFPSFVKIMLKSHVSGGFWLGLPNKFCREHLPKEDGTMVLVDENGKEFFTKYLVAKGGLSGGWRSFSIACDLVAEDVLVFQLIEPWKFKIFIVRARKLTEGDGAKKLPNLQPQPIKSEIMEDQPEKEAHNSLEVAPVDQSGDESDNSGSQIMDCIRFLDSPLAFKDVHSFQDFSIQVDGLIIDSEISAHLRTKYYELCLSQNMFLHQNLIPGLNTKLAAGMISEAINIADAIRVTKPSTDAETLECWDKTLKAFEDLGLVVGFLRARIHKLLSLGSESQALIERKKRKRSEAEEEMRELEAKVLEVKRRIESIDGEIDDLMSKNEKLEAVFMEVAGDPWSSFLFKQ